ncbi:MAG: hypothetical protein R3C53_28790, partial [Pirellulaceae bacterium]
ATSVDRLVLWGSLVSRGSLADSRGKVQTDFGKVSVCQRIGSFDVRAAENGWQTRTVEDSSQPQSSCRQAMFQRPASNKGSEFELAACEAITEFGQPRIG